MRSNTSSIISLVLVLLATSTLVSLVSMLKIDGIVHGDLYRYGLRFNYEWAMPYWTMTTIVFAMGWFNIITVVAFQFYVLIYGRKEALKSEVAKELQPQPIKEETIEMETKPTEKVEEYIEQAAKPAEELERKPEETQTVEDTSQREQPETIQTAEVGEPKEQESKPAEESEVETKETPTPATETEQEESEKSEEEPILIGVPEEEHQTTAEETPDQQIGTSPL